MDNERHRVIKDIEYCFEKSQNRVSIGFEAGKYFIWGWKDETARFSIDDAFIRFASELRKKERHD